MTKTLGKKSSYGGSIKNGPFGNGDGKSNMSGTGYIKAASNYNTADNLKLEDVEDARGGIRGLLISQPMSITSRHSRKLGGGPKSIMSNSLVSTTSRVNKMTK